MTERKYLTEELPDYISHKDIWLTPNLDHHVVGHEFVGYDHRSKREARWFCESHDQAGYWLYNTDGSGTFINVSERAIGRTFHRIWYFDGRMSCGSYMPASKIPGYS